MERVCIAALLIIGHDSADHPKLRRGLLAKPRLAPLSAAIAGPPSFC